MLGNQKDYTLTHTKKIAVQPTKPSSDDESGIKYRFRNNKLLPLAQSAKAVSYNITRLLVFYYIMRMSVQDITSLYITSFVVFTIFQQQSVNSKLTLLNKQDDNISIHCWRKEFL